MRTGTSKSSVLLKLAVNFLAMRELPPNSKKSSSNPTRSTPNTPTNADATTNSTDDTAARNPRAPHPGSGHHARSHFPDDLTGNEPHTPTPTTTKKHETHSHTTPANTNTPTKTQT